MFLPLFEKKEKKRKKTELHLFLIIQSNRIQLSLFVWFDHCFISYYSVSSKGSNTVESRFVNISFVMQTNSAKFLLHNFPILDFVTFSLVHAILIIWTPWDRCWKIFWDNWNFRITEYNFRMVLQGLCNGIEFSKRYKENRQVY